MPRKCGIRLDTYVQIEAPTVELCSYLQMLVMTHRNVMASIPLKSACIFRVQRCCSSQLCSRQRQTLSGEHSDQMPPSASLLFSLGLAGWRRDLTLACDYLPKFFISELPRLPFTESSPAGEHHMVCLT